MFVAVSKEVSFENRKRGIWTYFLYIFFKSRQLGSPIIDQTAKTLDFCGRHQIVRQHEIRLVYSYGEVTVPGGFVQSRDERGSKVPK